MVRITEDKSVFAYFDRHRYCVIAQHPAGGERKPHRLIGLHRPARQIIKPTQQLRLKNLRRISVIRVQKSGRTLKRLFVIRPVQPL
jgi:hypothetical protein